MSNQNRTAAFGCKGPEHSGLWETVHPRRGKSRLGQNSRALVLSGFYTGELVGWKQHINNVPWKKIKTPSRECGTRVGVAQVESERILDWEENAGQHVERYHIWSWSHGMLKSSLCHLNTCAISLDRVCDDPPDRPGCLATGSETSVRGRM